MNANDANLFLFRFVKFAVKRCRVELLILVRFSWYPQKFYLQRLKPILQQLYRRPKGLLHPDRDTATSEAL
jgi:hypothetical protein